MKLLALSISHKTAPVEVREKIWFSDDDIRATLPRFIAKGCSEVALFSTCNRTELYVVPADEKTAPAVFLEQMNAAKKLRNAIKAENIAIYEDDEAAQHLFRVASGIESMILGDMQILMQVKNGFQLAVEAGTVHAILHRLFQSALHAGKRTRSETTLGEGAVSVGYAAVELAEKIFETLHKKTALVIGAGETAKITAKHLRGKNIGRLLITNRTEERAAAAAKTLECETISFDRFREALRYVDIVISSVRVDRPIVTAADLRDAQRFRQSGALFLVDIGVPRNIEAAARELEGVFVYDIDTLNTMVDDNLKKRRMQVPLVETIVRQEVEALFVWIKSLEVAPTIRELTRYVEEIRRSEVEKNINRFDEKDRELVELVTKRITNKILHTPIAHMRNGHDETLHERLTAIGTLRKLFGLAAPPEKKDDDA